MKRRGFTLIELMVVIAIIIILAAIAIPNYLNMTARAKKSRVASDFSAVATALESYRTDWGTYPVTSGYQALNSSAAAGSAYQELSGSVPAGTTGAKNLSPATTAAGDAAPITYMTTNILDSMKNPYNSSNPYHYASSANGNHWTMYASESTGSEDKPYLSRSDTSTTLTEGATTPSTPAN